MDVSLLIKNVDGTHLIQGEWPGLDEPPAFHADSVDGGRLARRYFRWIGWDRTRSEPTPLYMEISLPAYRKAKAEATAPEREEARAA